MVSIATQRTVLSPKCCATSITKNRVGRGHIAALHAGDFESVGDAGQMSGFKFDVNDRADDLSYFALLCHYIRRKYGISRPSVTETASARHPQISIAVDTARLDR